MLLMMMMMMVMLGGHAPLRHFHVSAATRQPIAL